MSVAGIHDMGVAGLSKALAGREVSSVEVTQALLARAQADATLALSLAHDQQVGGDEQKNAFSHGVSGWCGQINVQVTGDNS